MKRSFALLLCAAVFACSSDRDRSQQKTSVRSSTPVAQDSMTHDSAMSAMRHDSASMAGMNDGHSVSLHGKESHGMTPSTSGMSMSGSGHHQMSLTSAAMPRMQHGRNGAHASMPRDMSPMQHHEMPMRHDTMQSMGHGAMDRMQHDTTHAMQHDAMPGMQHDTMHMMRHDTMPGMRHDTTHMMQHGMPGMNEMSDMRGMSDMLMTQIGSFNLMAMAQFFPTYTLSLPNTAGTPLENRGFYVTQPAIMANLSSRGERFVLRTTLNFEGLTQPGGELTYGGWGEGFLDKRHPHTLLHEFMLSWNNGNATRGFSISAGKGFAPYGTDDPMSRPIIKYPTNHHLSQALERWTLSGIAALGTWGLEGGIFGGQEPNGPYDLSNIESFADSWSARATKRFGIGKMGTWPYEISASFANIAEEHHGATERTRLFNVSIRHDHEHEGVPHYAMVEYSRSDPDDDDAYFALLGETSVRVGRHQPYARVEYATRPEYQRNGPIGTTGFFRYDHDADPIGATRWLIVSGGYGISLGSNNKFSPRPYVETQYNHVRSERGGVDPVALYGRASFWTVSAGLRVFVGGEPMRMGTYGVLDPMTAMHDMPGHQISAASHDH